MRNKILLGGLLLTLQSFATDVDTIVINKHSLDEVVVTGFKQENSKDAPMSVSSVGSHFIHNNELTGIRDMSSIFANFFMPDYGARQNAPIFIRGIGSKTNSPSVGVYVDGMPYFDRSVMDMDLAGISGVEVLRGPQGTLYGRNSTGGLINIYTYSPLDYQNTLARISYGSRNDVQAGLSHYGKLTEHLGLSLSANYRHNDGFFKNMFTGKKADDINTASGRLGLAWKPTGAWTMRLNVIYDYSDQGGYPYGIYHPADNTVEDVNYNRYGSYRRNLLSTGMNWLYEGKSFSFNSQTSFQYSKDKQGIDQDFTPQDLFYVSTGLKQTLYSQEFTMRSRTLQGRYHWIVGAFGFYQKVDNTVETQYIAKDYSTPKYYDNPTWGVAFYHQSTYDITSGLSASIGLRYDYEKAKNTYEAYKYVLSTASAPVQTNMLDRDLHFSQFTPKFTLRQRLGNDNMVYASVARGYKAGGFNTTFKTADQYTFAPEYNWNYELGTKLSLLHGMLSAEASVFYIDWKHQQITTTVPGVGNIINNAGRSDSKGFEVSLTARPIQGLEIQANYGYTYARFRSYVKSQTQNYSGNILPMVPRQTIALVANYIIDNVGNLLDRLMFNATLTGAGKIYWTEDNTLKQPFYTLLNLKVAATKGRFTWEVWSKNTTNTRYMSYAFATSSPYAQQGKPFMIGTSLLFRLNH